MTKFIELPDCSGENFALNVDCIQRIAYIGDLTRAFVKTGSQLEIVDIRLPYKEVVNLLKRHKLMEE